MGKRFGNGVVVSELDVEVVGQNNKYPRHYQRWKLQCDCGNEYTSSSRYLLYGQGTHCGCLRKENLMDKRFGNGIVIRYVGSEIRGKTSPRPSNVWELRCDCGKTFQTHAEYLKSGTTTSCGCQRHHFHNRHSRKTITTYFKTLLSDASRRNRKVKVTKSQLQDLLESQQNTCALSGLPITFNDGSASLDRIDNTGDYELSNIQWVHRKLNYMKNTLCQREFFELCRKVVGFHRNDIDIDGW